MIYIENYRKIRDYKKLKELLLKEKRWSFGAYESGLDKEKCIDLYIFVHLCNSDKKWVALDEQHNLLGIITINYLKKKKMKRKLADIAIKIFSFFLTKEQKNGINEYYYGTREAYKGKPVYESEISLLMTDYEKRNQGIGKKLLEKAESFLKEKQVKNVGVNTDSCCDYQFYERNGFECLFKNDFNGDELYFYRKNIKMKSKIVMATNNKDKLKEVRQILSDYQILSLNDVNCKIEVDEDKDTFEENSLKKAREISKLLKMPCIADDSGLCIEELDGFPGVKTARFLGENASQDERNNYLIKQLEKKENRKATVVTVMSYIDEEKNKEIVAKGELQGYIVKEKRGNNGFGFDEIFELENGKTLAELDSEEKNKISSRKLALENMKKQLDEEK